MSAVYTARPTLRYYQDRLRQSIAEPELVSDSDMLTFLSDGYKRLCERSGCLVNVATISLTQGTIEYALPTDIYRIRMLAVAGMPIDEISLRNSLADYGSGVPVAYYTYGSTIGFAPNPSADIATATLLYEATPTAPTGYDSDLDPRCLPEYRYGILHWVRWRLTQIDGGAQGITKANYERALFEDAVTRLRAASRGAASVQMARMRTVVEYGRALR